MSEQPPPVTGVYTDGRDWVQVFDRAQWRQWLADNHATHRGVWLVIYTKVEFGPRVEYEASVEEALCFGWIDGRIDKLDERRNVQWFTTRRPKSGWARTNKVRIDRLDAAGLMQPAGRAMIDAAKADGSWTLLDDVEAMVVPEDLSAALDADPQARVQWDAFPKSVRKGHLAWVTVAKRPATRQNRIDQIVSMAALGKRANEPIKKT